MRKNLKAIVALACLIVVLTLVKLLVFPAENRDKREPDDPKPVVLDVYNWAYYMVPALLKEFEDECGCRVNYREFPSNEELYAAIVNRTGGWDVVFPSDYMVTRMAREGLLLPLDKGQLEGFSNLDPRFLNQEFDPGNEFSLPYIWGASGIGYQTEKVAEVRDYDVLWDEKLAGRIGMLDDMRFTIGAALKRLGYSVNTENSAELEEAQESLLAQKPLVRTYNSENYVDLLVNGETWVYYGWSGDIIQAIPENPHIAFVIPESGGVLYVDNMVIPTTADAVDLAHEFIDFLLRPHVAARIINERWFAMPNVGAEGLVHREIRENPGVYPPDAVLAVSEQLRDLGDGVGAYEELWQVVKSK